MTGYRSCRSALVVSGRARRRRARGCVRADGPAPASRDAARPRRPAAPGASHRLGPAPLPDADGRRPEDDRRRPRRRKLDIAASSRSSRPRPRNATRRRPAGTSSTAELAQPRRRCAAGCIVELDAGQGAARRERGAAYKQSGGGRVNAALETLRAADDLARRRPRPPPRSRRTATTRSTSSRRSKREARASTGRSLTTSRQRVDVKKQARRRDRTGHDADARSSTTRTDGSPRPTPRWPGSRCSPRRPGARSWARTA